MTLFRFTSTTALHIGDYRRLLVWHLVSYFISISCSKEVKYGISKPQERSLGERNSQYDANKYKAHKKSKYLKWCQACLNDNQKQLNKLLNDEEFIREYINSYTPSIYVPPRHKSYGAPYKYTLLQIATIIGNVEVVKSLLRRQDIDVKARVKSSCNHSTDVTALHLALSKLLDAFSANIICNRVKNYMLGTKKNYMKIIDILVQKENRKIDFPTKKINSTDDKAIPIFLAQVFNQNNVDKPIFMHTMIERGDPLILKLIVPYIGEEDFDKLLNQKDQNGHTALDLAAIQLIRAKKSGSFESQENTEEIFNLLVNNLKSMDNVDKPIFMHRMIEGGDPLILKSMLRYIPKKLFAKLVEQKDQNGHTALNLAAIQLIRAKESGSFESQKNAEEIFNLLVNNLKSMEIDWINSDLCTNAVQHVMENLMMNNSNIRQIGSNDLKKLYNEQEQCTICTELLYPKQNQNRRNIVETPCKHYFHKLCLAPWYCKEHTCPNCKVPL